MSFKYHYVNYMSSMDLHKERMSKLDNFVKVIKQTL